MQHDTYRASVIIPVYNSAGTLRRAVQSALDQTLTDSEILIVDDGSKDDTFALACQLAKENCRIRVIALPANRGKPHAMNIAIAEARGTWIAVLDADDWYQPDRLGTLIAAAEANGTDLVADNQYCHDAAAGCVVRTTLPIADDDILLTKEIFIRGCNPFADYNHGMLKPILRAEFIRRTGLVYRENARLAEDFLYLVEFFAAGGVGFLLSQPQYNWTQPFGSLSRQWTTTGAGSWRYDFRSALVANAEVLDALRQRGETALADLLITRARAYNVLHHLGEINRLRATGATRLKILVLAARHPKIWLELARRLLRSVRHRASANRHAPLSARVDPHRGAVDRAAT
jgi:glycosyltransferase involved in cell wall biosynthesis